MVLKRCSLNAALVVSWVRTLDRCPDDDTGPARNARKGGELEGKFATGAGAVVLLAIASHQRCMAVSGIIGRSGDRAGRGLGDGLATHRQNRLIARDDHRRRRCRHGCLAVKIPARLYVNVDIRATPGAGQALLPVPSERCQPLHGDRPRQSQRTSLAEEVRQYARS